MWSDSLHRGYDQSHKTLWPSLFWLVAAIENWVALQDTQLRYTAVRWGNTSVQWLTELKFNILLDILEILFPPISWLVQKKQNPEKWPQK